MAINPYCVAAVRTAAFNPEWSEILLAGSEDWLLVEGKARDHTNFFCEVAKMGPGGLPISS